jgi:hypothetical protein
LAINNCVISCSCSFLIVVSGFILFKSSLISEFNYIDEYTFNLDIINSIQHISSRRYSQICHTISSRRYFIRSLVGLMNAMIITPNNT